MNEILQRSTFEIKKTSDMEFMKKNCEIELKNANIVAETALHTFKSVPMRDVVDYKYFIIISSTFLPV